MCIGSNYNRVTKNFMNRSEGKKWFKRHTLLLNWAIGTLEEVFLLLERGASEGYLGGGGLDLTAVDFLVDWVFTIGDSSKTMLLIGGRTSS